MKIDVDNPNHMLAIMAGALVAVTFIVCVTVYNFRPQTCYEEMRPGCIISGAVYPNAECLATVARACSGG